MGPVPKCMESRFNVAFMGPKYMYLYLISSTCEFYLEKYEQIKLIIILCAVLFIQYKDRWPEGVFHHSPDFTEYHATEALT